MVFGLVSLSSAASPVSFLFLELARGVLETKKWDLQEEMNMITIAEFDHEMFHIPYCSIGGRRVFFELQYDRSKGMHILKVRDFPFI